MMADDGRDSGGLPEDDSSGDAPKGPANNSQHARGRAAPPQFALRDLLWFVVACSAYFAQFRSDLFTGAPLGDGWERVGWHGILRVMVPWLLLAVFYVRTRLHPALAIHCAGPVLAFAIALLVLSDPEQSRNAARTLALGPVFGCLISTTVSFPASTLMILARACGRRR